MIHIDNVVTLKEPQEFIDAAVQLLAQASRFIRIRSAHLDPDLFNTREFNEALSAFARKSRYSEVQILVDFPDRLLEIDNKTVMLMRRLSPKIIIKEFFDDKEDDRESYILCDDRGLLIKYPDEKTEGFFSLTDGVYTKHLNEKFAYEWERSNVAEHLKSFIL